jgi:hypothetical protein
MRFRASFTGIAEVPAAQGFLRRVRIRFTLLFREAITIGGIACRNGLARALGRGTPPKRVSSTPRRLDQSLPHRRAGLPPQGDPVATIGLAGEDGWPMWRCPVAADANRPAGLRAADHQIISGLGSQNAGHRLLRSGTRCRSGSEVSLRERGRRRTRQDQISLGGFWAPVKLRTLGSAPNEESLFLLLDRSSRE